LFGGQNCSTVEGNVPTYRDNELPPRTIARLASSSIGYRERSETHREGFTAHWLFTRNAEFAKINKYFINNKEQSRFALISL